MTVFAITVHEDISIIRRTSMEQTKEKQLSSVKINWDKAVNMFGGPNKTFKTLPDREELEALQIVGEIAGALEEETNLLIESPSGIGKTSLSKALINCAEVDGEAVNVLYLSGALMSADNLKCAFPRHTDGVDALRYIIDERFCAPGPLAVLFDEPGQAEQDFFCAIMELLSEGTIGNIRPAHLVTTIMLDNPAASPYGRLNLMEFAQADRFSRVALTAADSPWPRAFAATYPDLNVGKAITVHNNFKFDEASREIANPRVLTQGVAYALTNGIPGQFGLPWVGANSTSATLCDPSGNSTADRDADGLETRSVARKYVDSLAEALGVPSPDRFDNKIDRALELVARDGISIYIEGGPGTGKTSSVKAKIAEKFPDFTVPYFSLGNTSKEDFVIPFPTKDTRDGSETGGLTQMTFDFFVTPGDKIVVLDEYTRGDERTSNVANEIVQEGTVNGTSIEGYRGTVAINNPTRFMGEPLDCRPLTLPQASRFALSFKVDHTDTGAFEWLLGKYGDLMSVFLEWHNEAFRNPEAREGVSPRTLERMFKRYRRDLPLAPALASPNGKRVEAPLGDLMAMLAEQPLARLGVISRDIEKYEARLAEVSEHGSAIHPMDHLSVYKAFSYPTVKELREREDTCVRLFPLLEDEYRYRLITMDVPEVQNFWHAVLAKVVPDA